MTQSNNPHVAILNVTLEMFEKDGNIAKIPVTNAELKDRGIKKNFLLIVEGNNKADCIEKLAKKIEEFNE